MNETTNIMNKQTNDLSGIGIELFSIKYENF